MNADEEEHISHNPQPRPLFSWKAMLWWMLAAAFAAAGLAYLLVYPFFHRR